MIVRCDVSAITELAWVTDLLVQTARYAEPALDELDHSLAPGIAALRPAVRDRFTGMWSDRLAGCPELLLVDQQAAFLEDSDVRRLLRWLTTLPATLTPRRPLTSEHPSTRRAIRRRISLLDSDVRLRRAYRDLLAEIWDVLEPAWERRGRAASVRAASEWRRRLHGAKTAASFVALMPPRHPLSRLDPRDAASLVGRRRAILVVPTYFCMSGGLVADLDDRLLVAVAASALEPIRRTRDAAFVSDRVRVLAEPTRVHILIHLMSSAPSGVMQITRALRMSQPTVSAHLRMLVASGLVRAELAAGRTVYRANARGAERVLRDVAGTLARWG